MTWRTSSYTDSTSCVEWARPTSGVLVRDTKCRKRARVPVSATAWRTFTDWAKTATV
ncbi:MAG: DUF397 domain-containing protein [Nonomuraea sp.]|nr:DUF397 domain-containing protein [Nonomuraea sp.]NUQ96406.1 DUF397 domain-containing protein [Streptomyces sp.]NUS10426.1 DUF397 domain-containing protein [Streptomyces sp.]